MFSPQFQKSFQNFVRSVTKDILLASTLLYLTLGTLEILREGMVTAAFPLNAVLGVTVGAGILETLFRLQEKEVKPQPLNSREIICVFLITVSLGVFVWQNVIKTAGVFAAATAAAATVTISFLFLVATLDTPQQINV